jgi:hypothetical protein
MNEVMSKSKNAHGDILQRGGRNGGKGQQERVRWLTDVCWISNIR